MNVGRLLCVTVIYQFPWYANKGYLNGLYVSL